MEEIKGVEVKVLKTHPDDRGFFREIVRKTDPFFPEGGFGQWSHSRMQKNVVKAWHYHHLQTDWWYIGAGCVEAVLFDNRKESPTLGKKMVVKMSGGEPEFGDARCVCVRIPPGVLHGLRVLSEDAHLFYITSHTYNPQDEGRYPFNDPIVEHDWGKDAITVENDRRRFEPTAARASMA